MTALTNLALVDVVDDVLLTTLSLARDLSEDDGARPTECPGWTVRDQLAHMVGLEQILDGAPVPDVELPALDHVVGDVGVFMEKAVHARRALPLVSIADELAGMRPRRIANLRLVADSDDDPMVRGPFGERPLSASLPVRVFDLWVHEQDIRRACGLPVRTDCAAAEIAFERVLAGWTSTLPEKLDGMAGTIVVVRDDSRPSETRIPLAAAGTEVVISGSLGALTQWFCGRASPTGEQLRGEPSLAEAVAGRLGVTP